MEWMHHDVKREVHHYFFQGTRLLRGSAASPTSWAGKAGITMHNGAAAVTGDGALEHSGGVAM
eukprot:1530884-Pyramimonas_sp.AAC.1